MKVKRRDEKNYSKITKKLGYYLSLGSMLGISSMALAAPPIYPVVVDNDYNRMFTGLNIPANAAQVGVWSGLIPWPIISIHSNMLPDGRLLTFGAPLGRDGQDGRTLVFWNPKLGFGPDSRVIAPNAQNVDSFCASAVLMNDGRLLATGGGSGASGLSSREGTQIDYRTNASIRDFDVNAPRWYGTMTKLPDGRAVFTGGGVPYAPGDPNIRGTTPAHSTTPEIYTPGQGWRSLLGAFSIDAFGAEQTRWWYPRQWVTPIGSIFGISTEKVWEMRVGGDGAIRTIRDFKRTPNNDTRPNVGQTSTAVMFDTGRVLQVGGNGHFNGWQTQSSNQATIFDFRNIGTGAVMITETNPMNFPRQWHNAVVLPNGLVLVAGGTRFADEAGPNTVLPAEIWNPATGRWTVGASLSAYRGYHSSTALLPNGTVFMGGTGAPGPRVGLDAEIYYPPYLFRSVNGRSELAPRPEIISLSKNSATYNEQIELQIGEGDDVAAVSFIAVGSTTHSFDSNQRFSRLAFTRTANGVRVTMPANANLAPPDYYHLSIINRAGVPSVSTMIGLNSAAPIQSRSSGYVSLNLNSTIKLKVTNNDPDLMVRHVNYGTRIDPINVNSSTIDHNGSNFIVRAGRGNPGCYSFESIDQRGHFLQHRNYRIEIIREQDNAISRNSSTWCVRPALSGLPGAISLESLDQPNFYMRHANFLMRMDNFDGSELLANDASFYVQNLSNQLPTNSVVKLQSTNSPDRMIRHFNFNAQLDIINSGSSTIEKLDSSFILREGRGNRACFTFEAANIPRHYLQHRAFNIGLIAGADNTISRNGSTFCARPALDGNPDSVSFESQDWPGHYLRHAFFNLSLARRENTELFNRDASFNLLSGASGL
jgi:galactose oxidase